MKKHEIISKLKENGFTLKKQGNKHEIWERDNVIVPISRGTGSMDPHTVKKFLKLVRVTNKEAS